MEQHTVRAAHRKACHRSPRTLQSVHKSSVACSRPCAPPETKILVARATADVVCCARVRVRRVFRGSACAASAFGDLCHDKRWPWGGKRRRLVLAASQRVLHATRSLGSQRNHYRSGELNCSRQESVALPTLHPEDVHKAQDGSWKAANLLRNDIQEASPAGARLNQPLLRG